MTLGSVKEESKVTEDHRYKITHLGDQGSLRGKAVLQIHCALVAGHALQQHFQHPTQNALLGFCYRNSLQCKHKDIKQPCTYNVGR